jgi:uncharacterized phage-like protein YoqJ
MITGKKTLITGHRLFKLKCYDVEWIKSTLNDVILNNYPAYGLSGMASGVDLWFCQSCEKYKIPYAACIPFKEQEDEVEADEVDERLRLIKIASTEYNIRNSAMVEKSEAGIVVWDGNKGGTHNVVQQLIENDLPFVWINPVSNKVWNCF